MTHFPGPPEDAGVRHILRLTPRAGRALMTLEPTRMVASDALAVFEAGWSERDLHDAVLTVGLFNLLKKLSIGALSQQLPLRLIEAVMPYSVSLAASLHRCGCR